MATISNTPRPGYVFDVTDNVWYPIGVGGHSHSEIAKTIADAKGDLIVGTAADTVDRLAVGNNGETLVADSSTATGLRYTENYAAGKNKIINGDFGIWQRGTSFSATGSSTYTADRWTVNAFGGTTTVSRQTFTPGTAPVAGYEGSFFLRFASSATFADLIQKIEDVRTFANQAVTVSFWAKAASSLTLTPTVSQEFGSGGSVAVDTAGTGASVTTSWTRFSANITVPSISGKTIGTGSSFWLYFLSSTLNTNIDIWGVQIEDGSVATAFQTATGTIQGELAACQRYFQIFGGNDVFEYYGIGANLNTVNANFVVQWYVPMRTAPTATFTTASNYRVTQGTSANTCTGAAGDILTKNNAAIQFTVASGLTSGNAVRCLANNTLSGTISVSAEL